jgi:ubiquinone/menaquinone biosynthesis C-methylase UbiE
VGSLPAEQAYDLWAGTYDEQDNNLLMHLDHELMFGSEETEWHGRRVLDFGCGTGRHWQTLLGLGVQRLVGVDLSTQMLQKLKDRFPHAEAHQIRDERLPMFADGELDVMLSNLTIGYVRDLRPLFGEWSRVLRPGGQVVITDLHPAAIAKGAKRTFTARGRSLEIQSYRHDLPSLEEAARASGLGASSFVERRVDEATKIFYERAGALASYALMRQTPLIYKLCLTKA